MEGGAMGIRKVEGRDCRQVPPTDCDDAAACCCSAAAMLLNHCVNAAINRPVALFTTAAGIPPPHTSPTEVWPDAAVGGWGASELGTSVASESAALPSDLGVAALRLMHSNS